MSDSLQTTVTSYWLKQREEQSFHAYVSTKRGAKPVCGGDSRIAELVDMDIPGDRSKLCNTCHRAMYGIPTALIPVEKITEHTV